MKKKLYFITNPISGSSFARYLRNLDKIDQRMIDKYLDLSKFDYEIWITEYEGHASELAMKGLNSNADLIVAIGGDGTIREIASVLIGTNTPLGIIPAGSGNGLALHLAIPLNLKGAIEIINRFNVSEIDTGSICLVNEKEEIKKDVFLSSSGVGFDALMAHRFKHLIKRGLWGYIKAIYKEYFSYLPNSYELEINGVMQVEKALLINIANSSQFGNNAIIAPSAKIDDGKFELSIVRQFPIYALPEMIFRLFSRSIDKSRYVTTLQVEEIVIKNGPGLVQLDGDSKESGSVVKIEVNRSSLCVLTP